MWTDRCPYSSPHPQSGAARGPFQFQDSLRAPPDAGWAAGPHPRPPSATPTTLPPHRLPGAQGVLRGRYRANAHPARSQSWPEAGSLQGLKTRQRTERRESRVSAPPFLPESHSDELRELSPTRGGAGWQHGQWALGRESRWWALESAGAQPRCRAPGVQAKPGGGEQACATCPPSNPPFPPPRTHS